MADEYWQQNCVAQFAKKPFRQAIWAAAYRRHTDGTLKTTMYEVSAVPYDPAEAEQDQTQGTKLLREENEEWANKMRKMVLSLGSAESDESEHLPKEETKFEGASTLDSEGDIDEGASQHEKRCAEQSLSWEMLDKITWAAYCPQDRKVDLIAIFKLGMKYVDTFSNAVMQPWNVDGIPTHMRPWLAELDLTLKAMMARHMVPRELHAVQDKYIRKCALGAEDDTDHGNATYDIIVNLMRLWQAVDEHHWDQVVKVASKEHGESDDKSEADPATLRGTIIEALLRWVQQMSATPLQSNGSPIHQSSCEEWYTWGM